MAVRLDGPRAAVVERRPAARVNYQNTVLYHDDTTHDGPPQNQSVGQRAEPLVKGGLHVSLQDLGHRRTELLQFHARERLVPRQVRLVEGHDVALSQI